MWTCLVNTIEIIINHCGVQGVNVLNKLKTKQTKTNKISDIKQKQKQLELSYFKKLHSIEKLAFLKALEKKIKYKSSREVVEVRLVTTNSCLAPTLVLLSMSALCPSRRTIRSLKPHLAATCRGVMEFWGKIQNFITFEISLCYFSLCRCLNEVFKSCRRMHAGGRIA